jgi:hypothetical protein
LDELPIHYFAIQNLVYHSHNVSVFYDWDGTRYGVGRELSVFIDGKRAAGPGPLKRTLVPLPLKARTGFGSTSLPIDFAVNSGLPDGPRATASSSVSPAAIAEAIDGRM